MRALMVISRTPIFVALALLAAACASSTNETVAVAADPIATPAPTATLAPVAETPTPAPVAPVVAGPSLSEAMAWVPRSAFDQGVVEFVDFVVASNAVGLDPIGCEAAPRVWLEEFAVHVERGSLVRNPPTWDRVWEDPTSTARSFGMPVCTVRSWLDWPAPGGRAVLYGADLDPALIEDAVYADETWSPNLEARSSNGADYWFWGDGVPERKSPARPFGEGGTFGSVSPGLLLRSPDEQTHLESLAANGPEGVMAEAGFAEMMSALEDAEAYRVQVSRGVRTWNGEVAEGKSEALLPADPLLQPYVWIGLGASIDRDQVATLILVHSTPDAALVNAAIIAEVARTGVPALAPYATWADAFTVESTEALGVLTVVSIRSIDDDTPAFLEVATALEQQDNFLWAPRS